MNPSFPLLAALEEGDRLLLKNMAHSGFSQTTIVFGSMAAVAILVFGFVYIFRKRLLRKRKHHHHHHRPEPVTSAETVTSKVNGSGRRKHRLRRGHRPINPTLAQTHGLPPIREPGTPPPGL